MRLHKIRLVNFRGVEDRSIEFDPDGITVVVGDNEVGKSSIFDGFNMILAHLHSGRPKDMEDAKPVGRDVGPEVEVELSTGEYRFEYRKRWLKDAEAVLKVSAPIMENEEGRAAHERVERILADTLDLNLWHALRMIQSGGLTMPGFDRVKSLGEAMDLSAADSPLGGGTSDSLYDKAEREYSEFWTDTGRVKKARKEEKGKAAEAQAKRDDLQRQQDSVDSDQRKLERLAAELDDLRQQEVEQEKEVGRLTAEWDSTEALRREADRLAQQEKIAEAEMKNSEAAQKERHRLRKDAETAERDVKNGKADLSSAEEAVRAASDHVRQAEAALESANNAMEEAERRMRTAEDDYEHHATLKLLADMRDAHDKAEQAQQQLISAEATITTCLSRVEADKIADAESAMDAAEATFAQSTATVTTTPLGSTSIEVDGEALPLEQGDEKEWRVDDMWEMVLPEQVRVSVQVGDDSKRLAEKFQAARTAYQDLCSSGGVADTAEARTQATDREKAEQERKEAERILEDCLSGTTLDALSARIRSTFKSTDSYVKGRSADLPLPEDVEEADATAAKAKHDHEVQKSVVGDRGQDLESEKHALTTAEGEAERARQALEEAETRAADAESALDTARQSADDNAIDSDLAAKRQRLEDLRSSAGKARSDMASKDMENMEGRLEGANGSLQRTKDDIQEIEREQIRLEGGLQHAGAQGLGTELAEAERNLELLERQVRSTETKADAAKLLYETLGKHRQSARDKHSEPFKREVELLGQIVFGSDFKVMLDEDMAIISRTLDKKTLSVDQLSVGAREQLGVLCRLACASITSSDGKGAPVVIDDALGWSDTARLQSMGQALAHAGKKCQVIILTCMPGRYNNVGSAKTVRL